MVGETSDSVAILGGGKIGEALLRGLLREPHESSRPAHSGARASRDASSVLVAERYPERVEYLSSTYGVRVISPIEAVESARTVLVAVKPHDVGAVLAEIAPVVGPQHLIVSVAAGITIATIEAALPAGVAVVRCMPNTPALVGEGMTALAAGSRASEDDLARAERLLAGVGRTALVTEDQLDAVTAVSGSGPAYFFLLVEALVDAAVHAGLPRQLALELARQTAVGASALLRESDQSPATLRENVTSPGGTTAAALAEFENRDFRGAVSAAVGAARRRSTELGS